MFSPSDSSVIGAVAHGHAKEIDEANFKPAWLESAVAKEVLSAAIDLSRQGKPINLLNILSRLRGIRNEESQHLVQIWSDGYGDVDAESAMNAARSAFVLRRTQEVVSQLSISASNAPGEVERWLPEATTKLVQLIRTGDTYDARPSAHWKKEIPGVVFRSLLPELNEVMRGGYRNGMLIIWAGITKHGKTSTLITNACDALLQKKRVALVNAENAEQKALARIMRGLSGLTEEEIATKCGNTPERDEIMKGWLEFLEDYLRIYNWEWLNDQRLKRIATWDKPDLVLIDYLRDTSALFADTKKLRKDPVGDMADYLLTYSNEHCLPVITAGQVSDQAAHRLRQHDTSEPAILYGSARVGYAADVYGLLKRHPSRQNYAYFRVWLDRLQNKMDTVTEIPFDINRWTLAFPQNRVDKAFNLV